MSTDSENVYDVIIIGGGPAGLSAAQYASRAKLKAVVLDKSPTAGALAYSSKIVNYPGQSGTMSGGELLNIFRKQALDFGAEYIETQVVGVSLEGDIKEVMAMDKTYYGKSVIIATGSMGRKASIKGEAELLGRGVSYCAICDAAFYKGSTVCVVGDSEEAIKEAELLTRFAANVYLIAPSKEIKRNHPALESGKVTVLADHRVTSIEGDDVVKKIKVLDSATNTEKEMPMDGVFVYLQGSRPIVDFLNFALELSDEMCIMCNRMMETSIPGVFAAGDVSCTEVRQVVVAASDGCLAALSAEKYVRHKKRRKLDWGDN
ncbi:MAG: FAD-dependent oxidoreductase [Nitrospirae bacterium]|nr:FAD-dependent oxidoreductase [Nitrospirota bacterium]